MLRKLCNFKTSKTGRSDGKKQKKELNMSKVSTDLIQRCFCDQMRLTKMPGYSPPKPCQNCHTFESYSFESNAIYHHFFGCPFAFFIIQTCEVYPILILGHRVPISFDSIIMLEFQHKNMEKTTKTQRICLLYD